MGDEDKKRLWSCLSPPALSLGEPGHPSKQLRHKGKHEVRDIQPGGQAGHVCVQVGIQRTLEETFGSS